jgi:AraC-like DNA-binding protein
MARPVEPDDDTRGIVDPAAGFERFTLTRYEPAPGLAWAVDRYWLVAWDVGTEGPHHQRVVPHPAFHLVFEDGRAEIQAITPEEFVRRLDGRGQVLGVTFRPAGFRPWLGRPAASLAGQRVPGSEVFGPGVEDLAAELASVDAAGGDLGGTAGRVDAFLAGLGVRPLALTAPVNALVDHVAGDRSVTRVDALAARLEVSTRRLQRLFADHVGMGPKWVINRFRIHEAAERAAAGAVDWAALAADLGFSDQSHLVREFSAAVGTPPGRYARRVGGRRPG